MGRILGIDFGLKRVGIAISDEEQRFSFGRSTIIVSDWPGVIKEILELCEKEQIVEIVIGWPKPLSGKNADLPAELNNFIEKIKTSIKIPVVLEDERMTTQLARRYLGEDVHSRNNKVKGKLDQLSAKVLLQNYLDKKLKRKA